MNIGLHCDDGTGFRQVTCYSEIGVVTHFSLCCHFSPKTRQVGVGRGRGEGLVFHTAKYLLVKYLQVSTSLR